MSDNEEYEEDGDYDYEEEDEDFNEEEESDEESYDDDILTEEQLTGKIKTKNLTTGKVKIPSFQENENVIRFNYLEGRDRKTSNVISEAELSRTIGVRSNQLEQRHISYADYGELTDIKSIALNEIVNNKCPINIIRKVSTNTREIWSPNEMIKPDVQKLYEYFEKK